MSHLLAIWWRVSVSYSLRGGLLGIKYQLTKQLAFVPARQTPRRMWHVPRGHFFFFFFFFFNPVDTSCERFPSNRQRRHETVSSLSRSKGRKKKRDSVEHFAAPDNENFGREYLRRRNADGAAWQVEWISESHANKTRLCGTIEARVHLRTSGPCDVNIFRNRLQMALPDRPSESVHNIRTQRDYTCIRISHQHRVLCTCMDVSNTARSTLGIHSSEYMCLEFGRFWQEGSTVSLQVS